MIRKILSVLILTFMLAEGALAGQIEVDAEDSLEWHRDKKYYVAKGKAKATQDGTAISAEELYAYYDDASDKEGLTIWKIEAKRNVLIEDADANIVGDYAEYNMNKEKFTVTGKEIYALSKDYQIKSTEKMEYFEKLNRVVATGDVVVYQNDNEMHCDKLTAYMTDSKEGKKEMSEVYANGNVVIITPTDNIVAQKGYYNVKTDEAWAEDDVVISREDTVITGDRADIDMKTGIAKMLSNSKDNRVKAVFVIEEE